MYKEILHKIIEGIPEDLAEKIFMSFFSTNKPTSEPSEPYTDRSFEYASEARAWLETIGFKPMGDTQFPLGHTQFCKGTVTARIISAWHFSYDEMAWHFTYDVKFTY